MTLYKLRNQHRLLVAFAGLAALIFFQIAWPSPGRAQSANVTTYHNDTFRTGWNSAESILTPANVGTGAFKLQNKVAVDEQVDAQPLFMSGQKIGMSATPHDVVYVATEANTIYAIDAASGAVLLSHNLGPAVPLNKLPGGCDNNSANVGITATPVIDPGTRTLYVITDTLEQGNAVYRLHALDTTTLLDKQAAVVVAASKKLSTGAVVSLSANTSRLRAGLLFRNGNIYAGFTSYCDFRGDVTRGWILGWNATNLAPLAANYLGNGLASSPDNFFLTTIWMSGYGIAADESGNLIFATSNADPSGTTYTATLNLSESVVKLSPDLTTVQDYFTPTGSTTGVAYMDKNDRDLGAGGVLVVPAQPGKIPSLATAMGKTGQLYLLNRQNLGHYAGSSADRNVATISIGSCLCGESYFVGSDNIGRIVTSANFQVASWKIQTTPATALVQESKSPTLATSSFGGFFTSVSSNGTSKGSAIVWAVLRPVGSSATLNLVAIDPTSGKTLTTQAAGPWPNAHSRANAVPVVANGRVFVASYKQLAIFGVQGGTTGNAVTVNKPNPLLVGTQSITGKEFDPKQPVFLAWRTYGTPVAGTSEWSLATVAADGTFAGQVLIDHAGTQSTMWVYSGDTPVQLAWTGTPSASSGGGPTPNAVTVNKPSPLIVGTQTITGKETDPTQPVFLDWRTYGTPVAGTSEWVRATVAGDGTFGGPVIIDHAGTQSTMWVYSGDTPVQAAWSGTPVNAAAKVAAAPAPLAAVTNVAIAETAQTSAGSGHEVTGYIVDVSGTTFSLRRHDGGLTRVAAENALRAYLSVVLVPGSAVEVLGNYDSSGFLAATSIMHASDDQATWDQDR